MVLTRWACVQFGAGVAPRPPRERITAGIQRGQRDGVRPLPAHKHRGGGEDVLLVHVRVEFDDCACLMCTHTPTAPASREPNSFQMRSQQEAHRARHPALRRVAQEADTAVAGI